MALTDPAPRQHIHTRQIRCQGFKRDDGLWDIEGEMTDIKTYSFSNKDRGTINSGEPIHHMLLRLTVDDALKVHDIEAVTEKGPYAICGDITPALKGLVGASIKPGWRREVIKHFGGTQGCTHLSDMLQGPMAVTAWQTIIPARQKRQAAQASGKKPVLLDTCHALDSHGSVVARDWPAFYIPPTD